MPCNSESIHVPHVGGKRDHRYFSGTYGIGHRKRLGNERPAIRDGRFGTALDISFVRFEIGRSILPWDLVALGLGRVLVFMGSSRHRSRGVRFGFVQLFTQCCNLFLDHLFECTLFVAVINGEKDQGRNTT